jgi:DNA/RNA-binding domain of Phe-tRNA-synthetase-like protein
MKYVIDDWVFEKNPDVCASIIIGKGLKNSKTTEEDSQVLAKAEAKVRAEIDPKALKEFAPIADYREALRNAGINPNKFTNSVEAMSKRVTKSGNLPRINALVDLCNAVALEECISLGAHDLRDIDEDLAVRKSVEGDVFLPFGAKEFEAIPAGELVFISGSKVQTRQWLWRQSELGKILEDSSDILFQLVGFKGAFYQNYENAIAAIEDLVSNRFGGTCKTYRVDVDQRGIEFEV